jgi:tripartite-type tricarboxylate transporter receptor subunit TctC
MPNVISRLVFAFLVSACASPSAWAQDYPVRPIRVIVPYLAGGGVDAVARILSLKLSDQLGQQIVIENRAGASGTIGANAVAKSAPDGYTLLLGPGDFITMAALMPKMAFDPEKDLVPVMMLTSNPMVVVANVHAPFNNLAELLAAAKAKPGEINYGTPGNGTLNQVAAEWMAAEAHIKLQHIPYRGGSAAANGIAAGDVPLGVISPPSAQPLVDARTAKVIALTGKVRPSFLPANWPTLAENGLAVDALFWTGLFAPVGTPPEIIARLEKEVDRVLQDRDVIKLLNDSGLEAAPVHHASFVERIRSEKESYQRIIERAGIRVGN